MQYVALVWVIMALLFLGMLGMTLAGHRYGRSQLVCRGETAETGTGIVEGALFGLLGLLMAFTFATSYSQYNLRRSLAVEEANAIGTAYLQLDVLSAAVREPLRQKFRYTLRPGSNFGTSSATSRRCARCLTKPMTCNGKFGR